MVKTKNNVLKTWTSKCLPTSISSDGRMQKRHARHGSYSHRPCSPESFVLACPSQDSCSPLHTFTLSFWEGSPRSLWPHTFQTQFSTFPALNLSGSSRNTFWNCFLWWALKSTSESTNSDTRRKIPHLPFLMHLHGPANEAEYRIIKANL